MTNDQRQQTVAFLRQLAEWLEDGKELQYRSYPGTWGTVPDVVFNGIVDISERLRVKPKPLEGWLVIVTTGHLYCTTPQEAEAAAARNNHVRTVHLREVQ
jgi:hypothetical protein